MPAALSRRLVSSMWKGLSRWMIGRRATSRLLKNTGGLTPPASTPESGASPDWPRAGAAARTPAAASAAHRHARKPAMKTSRRGNEPRPAVHILLSAVGGREVRKSLLLGRGRFGLDLGLRPALGLLFDHRRLVAEQLEVAALAGVAQAQPGRTEPLGAGFLGREP